jgi:hypothetical protein
MTTISLSIPDNITQRVLDGYCKTLGYQDVLGDGTPNPETKSKFVKRTLGEYIKQAVRLAEIKTASQVATDSAAASADTDIQIS